MGIAIQCFLSGRIHDQWRYDGILNDLPSGDLSCYILERWGKLGFLMEIRYKGKNIYKLRFKEI